VGDVREIRSTVVPNVLLCDDERDATGALAAELEQLGVAVTVVRTCADAFAAACALDLDALVAAPYVRDGSALVLPAALGIRRPKLVVLTSRMTDRVPAEVARRVGFDAQLTKVVDARQLERLVRASLGSKARDQDRLLPRVSAKIRPWTMPR
jgi:DNA-binding response OmpR family regulator